jgi:hypothetical protein
MSVELAPHNETPDVDRKPPPEMLQRLVKRGEMEVVTTASGEVLYILQSLDE